MIPHGHMTIFPLHINPKKMVKECVISVKMQIVQL